MGRTFFFPSAITADSPAREVVLAILTTLLRTIRKNEAGVFRDDDIEFLHDYRVAVRRTRACLGQLRRTLPAEAIRPFRREFSWHGSVTGPTRDLDVFLVDLARLGERLPQKMLLRLTVAVAEDRAQEQAQMIEALRSDRYLQLIEGWGSFLAAPPAAVEYEGVDAARPIGAHAVERIERRYKKMRRRGSKLDATTATAELHRLRLDGKKLRYLLEFFRPLFSADSVEPLIATLKLLQDNLGRFNDLQVQQAALVRYRKRLKLKSDLQPLLERLALEERKTRRRFAAEFEPFSTADTMQRIRELSGGSR